jgi:hypothetical protein
VGQKLDDRQRGVFSIPTKPPAETSDEALDEELRDVEISGLKSRLIDQTKLLNKYLEEAATYGTLGSAPMKLQNDIEKIQETIAEIKEQLAALEGRA